WTSTKLECNAVAWAVQKLRHYLWGTKFELFPDHMALLVFKNMQKRFPGWSVALVSCCL
ncbi:unnamed protein product, partial [Discosporangium mesarthrocarpum]